MAFVRVTLSRLLSRVLDAVELFAGPVIVGGLAVLFLLGCWILYEHWDDCKRAGGHEVVASYMPMYIGKVFTLQPVYECEGARKP